MLDFIIRSNNIVITGVIETAKSKYMVINELNIC